MGAVLYRAGRHEEAIEWLTELDRPLGNSDTEAISSAAYIWYFLAMVHQRAGNETQARQYLNKANQWSEEVLDDELNPPAWNRRATLELLRNQTESLLAGRNAVLQPSDKKSPQRSGDMTLSSSGPCHWVLHYCRARRFAAQGNWTEADSAFSQALTLRPDVWQLWKERGAVHEKLDQWDEAIADYQRAIELKPAEWPSWIALAGTFAQSKQWDKAMALYDCLIEHNSANRELWQSRAAAHAQLKQWDLAIADYDQVIKLNPDEPDAFLKRADVYRQMGEHEKAIACYRKAIELDPKYAMAHNNLGNALKAQGKLDEAIACYRKAIELDPKYAWPTATSATP